MNKDKLKQVAKELKGASKKHSGQADKIMSAIKQKHPFYPSDDPIIKRRLKEEEEKYRKEDEGIQNFRNMFNDAVKDRLEKNKEMQGKSSGTKYSEVRKGLKDKSESSFKLKDACYYKAKKAHKVFPSAYASGMIAKCRKNKGKKEIMAFKIKKPIMYSTEGYKKDSPDVNKPVNIIGSGNITMKGVEFDVLGIDNEGNSKVMKPGKDYSFKGHTVIEIPLKKKMGDFKHSDAPDAKGKFKELSAPALATWMIKSRKGNLSKIISSLNQQIVFRRNKDPKYAAKMKKTQDIVRKRLKKDDKSPLTVRKTQEGLNLKRWFKEEWKDEKGNVCGSDKNKNTKVCRPSKRVSKDSPKSWGEMTKAEKSKVVRAKKKVGMGRRRASSSNVS